VTRSKFLSVLVVIGVFALLAAGCGGSNESSTGTSGGTGGGGKTVKIVSDLPLQGSSAAQTEQMNNAIKLYLQEIGNKVGDYTVQFEGFDDSTAAKGAWDEATCAANARKYVEDESIIGVIGTFNSGCAKIEVPIANEASLAYISPANTGVGLTHVGPGSEPGEPEKYYPNGTRNYARVVTPDDVQGQIDATYMKDKLGVTKVFILDDKDAYGKGVADAFEAAAKDIGLAVAGHEGWDANAQNYKALMTQIKATGADGIFIGGISCFNGGQLVKDKVAVLGDNTKVKMMGPDGFTGYPDLLALPQAEGMYLTFAGLSIDQLIAKDGPGKKLIDAYTAKYGSAPTGSYPLYGVAATQVILAAIAKSDGTREGVTSAVFGSDPITIPESESVTGKEIQIDPKTGDTTARDITVEEVKGGKETFVKAQSVEG